MSESMLITITSGDVHTVTLPANAPYGQTVTAGGHTVFRDRELLGIGEDGEPKWRMFWRDEDGKEITKIELSVP